MAPVRHRHPTGERPIPRLRAKRLAIGLSAAAAASWALWVWREIGFDAGGTSGIALLIGVPLLLGGIAVRRRLAGLATAERAASGIAAHYRLLAENSSDIILRVDRSGLQHYVSPSVEELLGHHPLALLGQPWRMLADAEDRPALDAALERLCISNERATVQYRCRHRDGHVLWVEASLRLVREADCPCDWAGAIVNIRDVTWRKQAEDELAFAAGKLAILAATDGLTGLANRRSFDETLQREWRRARRGMTHIALLLLDADWFKAYNDQYGHQKGDDALRAISSCIGETIKRPGDLAARYGGEEFAVVLPGIGEAGAMTLAREIRTRLAALAVTHDGTPSGLLTVSIGIAAFIVLTDRDPNDLIAAADEALYAAKRAGRDRIITQIVPMLALAAD